MSHHLERAARRARRIAVSALLAPAAALAQPEVRDIAGEPRSVGAPAASARITSPDAPPEVPREFRAVWVTSVSNMDWPSRMGLSTDEQKAELRRILDRAVELRLNAIILQVRPGADALYASELEPWSAYLTGAQGRAPSPFYDPLAFAVEEAHARGLELHAWFNPYRARHPSDTSRLAASHIARRRPELVRKYGPYLWLDPGDATVRDWTKRVILDVVKRYDIDGVHIDDYFYPYREENRRTGRWVPFPDDATWRRYRASGGTLARDDWRRRNVNLLVEQLYEGVKATKPWVKFGVSPFGIWRPGHPQGVTGLDSYVEIFADSRTWWRNGWVDYLAPQLYWTIGAARQSYPALLEWWAKENTHGRHLWPGNYTSRVLMRGRVSWRAQEIVDQVRATQREPGAGGNIHFSMEVLLADRDSLGDRLAASVYAERALVPASPWLDRTPPAVPVVKARLDSAAGRAEITTEPAPGGKDVLRLWTLRYRYADRWTTVVTPASQRTHVLETSEGVELPMEVVVTAIDRVGNESRPARRAIAPAAADSAR